MTLHRERGLAWQSLADAYRASELHPHLALALQVAADPDRLTADRLAEVEKYWDGL